MGFLPFVWFAGIVRCLRTLRISCYPARIRQLLVVIRPIPVARPLPYVSRHIIKAVAVRRESRGSADSHIVVFPGVPNRKLTLKGICHPLTAGTKLVSPNILFSTQTTSRREFPLRL